jgi:restriction endonuclease S subunit
MKYLKAAKIAVPPLAEQKKIGTDIEKCEHEIAVAEARLVSAAADKSAILAVLLKHGNE